MSKEVENRKHGDHSYPLHDANYKPKCKHVTTDLVLGSPSDLESYLTLDNLSVGYNQKALIEDICMDIKKGEIVALIGPNGAGKSTILKTLSKQLEIIHGNVELPGVDLKTITYQELAQKMAVVLTDRIRSEYMTCYDVVATGRYPYTGRLGKLTHEDEDKVEETLDKVGARELGPKDYNATSDGQKQRVLLARALCQEPEIILLDEPTSFLDIHYKLDLLTILRKMAREQSITVVMSLHEIDLAAKVADRIICVSGERIISHGSPDKIFESANIRELYNMNEGSYDPAFGSLELSKPEGDPKAFVISSGGSGLRIYRNLQKNEIPFAAGILYENDIDYQLAKTLASQVISEKPFVSISDRAYRQAIQTIDACETVFYTGVSAGEINKRIFDLVDYARQQGKLEEV